MKIDLESQPLPSEAAATEWKTLYERAYHPMAYGTRLCIEDNGNGTWTVRGSRYNSAD